MPEPEAPPATLKRLRTILKSQYCASLLMLRQAIERCPDDLWTDTSYANPLWHIAYHVTYCAHLYLHPSVAQFRPWAKHKPDTEFMGTVPGPLPRPPNVNDPYTKDEVLEYLALCEDFVSGALEGMDLEALECGFPWYPMSKLEHQFVNIRHIQHHAAQIIDRLRTRAGIGVSWVGGRPA